MITRPKMVMGDIISINQFAFIPRRLISDNIIISHECLTYMGKQKKGNVGYATLKLDMSKA